VLQHVGIEVASGNLARAEEFWTLLGFRRVEPPPDLAEGFTWFERDGTQIHLMHEERPTVPPRGHVAVVVPDFDPTLAALEKAGFEVERRRAHWGAPRALATAPGDHRVELMEQPPRSASSQASR
jgi:catechol 2,3-dioxygenase-like lactoylglutathione lyase family enzyme